MLIRPEQKKKKGFTLVEVIVVLVILAILAAILVPKLTGWIDEAKNKSAVGEAHLVLSALQAYTSEEYAKGTSDDEIWASAQIGAMKYVEGDVNTSSGKIEVTISGIADGKVMGFDYTATNDVVIHYEYADNKGTFTAVPKK